MEYFKFVIISFFFVFGIFSMLSIIEKWLKGIVENATTSYLKRHLEFKPNNEIIIEDRKGNKFVYQKKSSQLNLDENDFINLE
jgi:hypothetical protein